MPYWTLVRRAAADDPYRTCYGARLLREAKGVMIEAKAGDRRRGVQADYRLLRTDSRRQSQVDAAIAAANASPFRV